MSPASRLFDILGCKAAEGADLADAELLDLLADAAERLHGRADLQLAAFDPAGQEAADEGVGAQRRGQHAEILVVA